MICFLVWVMLSSFFHGMLRSICLLSYYLDSLLNVASGSASCSQNEKVLVAQQTAVMRLQFGV